MDLGADRRGVDLGPVAIRYTGLMEKIEALGYTVLDKGDIVPKAFPDSHPKMKYLQAVNEANARLYDAVDQSLKEGALPVVIGGDHSIASASIAAVQKNHGNIGIIWVDAHGDFNNEETSPSGNMHGMPLSAVCGAGPDIMVAFCEKFHPVDPKNVVLIGGRDFDSNEVARLKASDVTVFSIAEIDRCGMGDIMKKAIDIASKGTKGIHFSFDMDAITPADAPGVSTPVHSGLTVREAFLAAEMIAESGKLLSVDLVEINTILDSFNKTAKLACELILSSLGKKIY